MQLLAQSDLAQSCGRMGGPLCNSNPLGWKLSDRCPHSTFSLLRQQQFGTGSVYSGMFVANCHRYHCFHHLLSLVLQVPPQYILTQSYTASVRTPFYCKFYPQTAESMARHRDAPSRHLTDTRGGAACVQQTGLPERHPLLGVGLRHSTAQHGGAVRLFLICFFTEYGWPVYKINNCFRVRLTHRMHQL